MNLKTIGIVIWVIILFAILYAISPWIFIFIIISGIAAILYYLY